MSRVISNIKELKEIISTSSISEVVNNYILSNDPICFDHALIYKLRKSLSDHFDVHLKNIEIVGSAKIGISLNPTSGRWGKKFDGDSDIDLAIVSNELFDIAWHELIKNEDNLLSPAEKEQLKNSYKYISQGIISPDQLPLKLEFSKKWWHIFSILSENENFEKRKIRGRLFKNWWFVEKYYSKQLANLSHQ